MNIGLLLLVVLFCLAIRAWSTSYTEY